MKKSLTGGELNLLNGQAGISAPNRSVAVMKLIRVHKPKSKAELEEMIKSHYESTCECGVVSQGTVQDFGKNLYDSQQKFWNENKYSLQECIQWEYDLFITQSLKGNIIESKARDKLAGLFPQAEIKEAEGYIDEDLRVDLIVELDDCPVCGIQVKPDTFNKMRGNVITFNKVANEKWGNPVYYLFYDDNERFINIEQVALNILELL